MIFSNPENTEISGSKLTNAGRSSLIFTNLALIFTNPHQSSLILAYQGEAVA
jgi:orotate phosphoribosyltransferase